MITFAVVLVVWILFLFVGYKILRRVWNRADILDKADIIDLDLVRGEKVPEVDKKKLKSARKKAESFKDL